MLNQIRSCVLLFIMLTVVTGVLYPLAVTAVAFVAFPHAARGSVLVRDGQEIGSELIGQGFETPEFFWGRTSATSLLPYNGLGGGGSNFGPTNPALIEAVSQRISKLRMADPASEKMVPVDLVTVSASGLDPHISPAAAYYQVARVAKARGIAQQSLKKLVEQHIEPPMFGVLGQARVNVLKLNLALLE